MKTYKTAMTILGLSRGDTFSSDDPGWDKYVEGGFLTVVSETPRPKLTVVANDPDPTLITLLGGDFEQRVVAGDPTPVKKGEFYREEVPGPEAKTTKSGKRRDSGEDGGGK